MIGNAKRDKPLVVVVVVVVIVLVVVGGGRHATLNGELIGRQVSGQYWEVLQDTLQRTFQLGGIQGFSKEETKWQLLVAQVIICQRQRHRPFRGRELLRLWRRRQRLLLFL